MSYEKIVNVDGKHYFVNRDFLYYGKKAPFGLCFRVNAKEVEEHKRHGTTISRWSKTKFETIKKGVRK